VGLPLGFAPEAVPEDLGLPCEGQVDIILGFLCLQG